MNKELLLQLTETLKAKDITISLAESCTGGLFATMLTAAPGVSPIFLGSVVCYSNQSKERLLGVSHEDLEKEGAVSETVARQMAIGARESFGSDYAASITGLAGPEGGTPEKPVGTVWFAVAGPGFVHSEKMVFQGERTQIQSQSADHSARMLLREIIGPVEASV